MEDLALMSLLLTFNSFPTLFCCFYCCRFSGSIADFEQISHLPLISHLPIVDFEQINAGWDIRKSSYSQMLKLPGDFSINSFVWFFFCHCWLKHEVEIITLRWKQSYVTGSFWLTCVTQIGETESRIIWFQCSGNE